MARPGTEFSTWWIEMPNEDDKTRERTGSQATTFPSEQASTKGLCLSGAKRREEKKRFGDE